MLMKNLTTGHLIEVEDLTDLTNPFASTASGRELWGEEVQDLEAFNKADLGFPSGEPIPLSWTDPDYQAQIHAKASSRARAAGNNEAGAPEAEQAGYNGA